MKKNQKVFMYLILIIGLGIFSSCGSQESSANEVSSYKELIVGSWKDTSESTLHFTLLEDGTARSDNMATLIYKNWKIDGNRVIFTVESIGNGTSSIGEDEYEIEKLTNKKMILKQGNTTFTFKK